MKTIQNILLIYPEIPRNTFWSFSYALEFINKKSAQPPLGLITVAAHFPEKYYLKLIDMNVESLTEADIAEADMVFVSAMIVQKQSLKEVIAMCNRLNKPIIAGGAYPTSSYKEIQGVDHFILGEIENTFSDILSDIEAGKAKKVYLPPERPDITYTPIPRFDLLKLEAYGTMSVQYSRGCPFRCEFCDIWKVYGNKPRLKSHHSIIAELDRLYELGWRGALFIVDDNFIGNKKRVKNELLPALISWQKTHTYSFNFFTEASINLADDDALLTGMQKAGFSEVFIGIETPSEESLKETGKQQNLKINLKEAVKKIQAKGIEVMAGFILGFDSDTEDIFDRQIAFIQETGIPQAMVGLLNALPGTDLFQRMAREGRILSETMGNNTHNMTTNFKTIMDETALKEGYKRVLSTIYDKNLRNYFARCNKLMDNLGDTSHYQREIGYKEIVMLLKSLFRQPLTPYGAQYIKFIIRNLFRHGNIFGEVIRYAIYGHHFHMITQETLKVEQVALDLDRGYGYLREQISQYVGHSKDVFGNIIDLWDQRQDILESIQHQIEKVHIDFRDDIITKYNDIADKMNGLFFNFKDVLTNH